MKRSASAITSDGTPRPFATRILAVEIPTQLEKRRRRWAVTNQQAGKVIARDMTRKAALQAAREMVARDGMSRLVELLVGREHPGTIDTGNGQTRKSDNAVTAICFYEVLGPF